MTPKSYGSHLLREAVYSVRKFFADLCKVFSIFLCLVGVGLLVWGFFLNLGSFLQSPLGIKPDFHEPYVVFGLAAFFYAGIIAFVAYVIRPTLPK